MGARSIVRISMASALACLFMAAPAAATHGGSPPRNDDFADAEDLGTGTTVQEDDTNIGATKEPGEPDHAGDPGGASIWYSWTAPVTGGRFRVDSCYSGFDSLLAVYTGPALNLLTEVASDEGACGDDGRVFLDTIPGMTYMIAIDGSSLGGTQPAAQSWTWIRIRPAAEPLNDQFANAEGLGAAASITTQARNVDASREPGEPAHAGQPGAASVWYRWTAPSTGLVRLDTCSVSGSDWFDSLLAVYTGASVDALDPVGANDDDCGDGERLIFAAGAGTTYRIAIDGWDQRFANPSEGSRLLRLKMLDPPPNDDFADALSLGAGIGASADGTNVDATQEAGELDHEGLRGGTSVWYRWTAPASGTFTVRVCDAEFYPLIAVYGGSPLGSLQLISTFEARPCTPGALGRRRDFNAVAGTTYSIAVDGARQDPDRMPGEGAFRLELGPVEDPVFPPYYPGTISSPVSTSASMSPRRAASIRRCKRKRTGRAKRRCIKRVHAKRR